MAILLSLAIGSGVAQAVLIDTGDGTGNTTAPADDPGFANVGTCNGLSVVYLGNRWVLTANHVGICDAVFGTTTYASVTGSMVQLSNPDTSLADLIMFRLEGDPGLSTLTIATSKPSFNKQVWMIGRGKARGAAYSFGGNDGWEHTFPFEIRWGTNRVLHTSTTVVGTESISTEFDEITSPGPGDHEAAAALGDSGGAVFAKFGGNWKLTGTLLAASLEPGQQAQTTIYTNLAFFADLSYYRSEIESLRSQPSCNDGLDDDGDGATDYPADVGCTSALDTSETSASLICDDGVDNDGDGQTDFPDDPGCSSSSDASEASLTALCDDGVDNDGDSFTDYPADPGCASLSDLSENDPALVCDDGIDNDSDGFTDFPFDPQCDTPTAPSEAAPVSALGPLQLGTLSGLLASLGAARAHWIAQRRASRLE